MATVYAVASAKGGVGKTTTAAAVATVLAGSGADVVAIDADVGMANLSGALGIDPGVDDTTIHDVLAGRADPMDAVHEGPNGLRVIPGDADLDAYAEAEPAILREVVDAVTDAEYVVLDVGAGLSHESTLPLGLADETLLVSTPDRDALGDTEKTRQLTERLGGTVAGAAITRTDPNGSAVDLVSELLETDVLGRIPEDQAVGRASRAGEPLVTFAPTAPATRAYRALTRELTGVSIPEPAAAAADEAAEVDEADDGAHEADDEVGAGGVDEGGGTDPSAAEGDEDDIIVADPGPVGIGEADDAEEIIVADETEADADAPEPDEDATADAVGTTEEPEGVEGSEDAVEPEVAEGSEPVGEDDADEPDVSAEAVDTEDHDDATDQAAQTDAADRVPQDGTADDSAVGETDDDAPAESTVESTDDADGEAVESAEVDVEGSEAASDDPEDELAGSVPFRDDDSGMETALSTERDEKDEDEGKRGGFFSRLFGR